jgi:Ca2+-binding RTX toxin-like protein
MLITGTTGNDSLPGTADADDFRLHRGGDDTVAGLAGNDVFRLGGQFTALDHIDGGDDLDELVLKGDYAAGVTFGADTLTDVESLRLAAGFDYRLATHDNSVASGGVMTVLGNRLGAADTLAFDGSAEADGRFEITGGGGDDTLVGGDGADGFLLTRGGADHASGGDGADRFRMGGALTSEDRIDGGAGYDTVVLTGLDGADALVLADGVLRNVDRLLLREGFTFQIVTHDATVAAGEMLTVAVTGPVVSLAFDGSAETDGRFQLRGAYGADHLVGGAQDDFFGLARGGDDFAAGGDGDDHFVLGAVFDADDAIAGGAGSDMVLLDGDYPGLTLAASTLQGIETLRLAAGHDYNLTTHYANVGSGQTMTVDGSSLGVTDQLAFVTDASTSGSLVIEGGAGSDQLVGGGAQDTLTGGSAGDRLVGGGANDELHAGSGADTLVYTSVYDSTGVGLDRIVDLDLDVDNFDLFSLQAPTAIDSTVTGGPVSVSTFESDLSSALGGNLGLHHAIILTVDGGDFDGHDLLVLDCDGQAGYLTEFDLVIDITGYSGVLETTDFVAI